MEKSVEQKKWLNGKKMVKQKKWLMEKWLKID